ncbi:AIPR family protein, partial [Mammaliicoccus lentus]|uniref:AIPR family protein n=1 Tax=Mammaliicoccus lentus TaxID=42858 RepID=UPI001C4FD56C
MASINDFKLIKLKSMKYYEMIKEDIEVKSDTEKARFGFYIFMLECLTNNTNLHDLKNCIIDTEFRMKFFKEENNDLGIDAVYIDEENMTINLFNFKFRENFKAKAGQKLSSLSDSSKFMLAIENENTEKLDCTTKKVIEEIINRLNSMDRWLINLYCVSNENLELQDDQYIDDFSQKYNMEINSIVIDDIIDYISDNKNDIDSTFVADIDSVIPHKENELSSATSYLVKMSLNSLIKITCDDIEIRESEEEFNIENLKEIQFESDILNDNVRGFLGDTKYNTNIINTIDKEPENFFLFNNGITITANNIKGNVINGKKRFLCNLKGMSIVNGGQTVRSIYKYIEEEYEIQNLDTAKILVRFISTNEEEKLKTDIAEYTNSQNAISVFDLKSISYLQISLETFLKENDIQYVRKAGDTGDTETLKYRISKEELAQILYSLKGFPERATNQKKALFSKYYNDIFNDSLEFEDVVPYIKSYKEIEQKYIDSDYNGFNSKYLY